MPACRPVSDTAREPSSATAIAASAQEIDSPTDSSASSSRSGGRADMPYAMSTRSSVDLPIADSTATTPRPERCAATMRSATARSRSWSATEVPPNFHTSGGTGAALARRAASMSLRLLMSVPS